MTTYLGDKAVGIGTVKATMSVGKVITDNRTILGDGFTEPLSVDTEIIATKVQVGNLATTLHAEIDAQADAIAKTRNDMNEKDSELESILNEHAEELTTLRGNQASLGDQVSNIESKIPQSASGSNPLVTKQQLLDEEMDIRDDYNELVSELQTQITAQAGAIASKQDKLTAGDGISIVDNVISATTAKSEWGKITGELSAQTDLQDALGAKQDTLTAGANIRIEDNVISSTAQESFFRGTWKNWNYVSTNPEAYAVDYHGNKTPKENDYIVVQDTSDYRPGYNRPITVKVVGTAWGQNAWTLSIDGGENFTVPRSGSVIEKDYQGFKLVFTSTYENVYVSATVDTVYESNFVVAGETIFTIPVRAETGTEYVSYWGGSDIEYQGSWRFSYHGVWETDGKNGWTAEYQIEETLPIADETQMGIAKLYTATGSNEDGAMTQKAITENTTRVIIRRWE